MSKVIGIDLGTTNSCVSVTEGGRTVIIPNENGSRTTPSVVAFLASGERLVGEAAKRQECINPDRTVSSVKRKMGTGHTYDIDGRSYLPQEISAMILARLKADAETFLGEPVTDAVITVPAYFNDTERQATKDAGSIAGLNVRRIINEPTAAALAYGLNNSAPKKIMVYDLGGGTFDVSVIEIGEGVIEVLATNGNNRLGGDDFDLRITDFLLTEIKKIHHGDIKKDPVSYNRVKEAAVTAKKELSFATQSVINLPYLAVGKETVNFEYVLTRAKLNELIKDLVDETEKPVLNALNDAGISPRELSMILLVGGSTRIPLVQETVKRITGIEPSKTINPDECVAEGAAIQGDILSGGEVGFTGNEMLLLDVTPMSLSIETVGGVATRLIERNSTLPVRYSRVFSTAAPFQRDVEIHVLQGERPMARDNKSIGKFKLTGIKRAPAGVPRIEVTFDIDTNGILKVSAEDLDTGTAQSIVITASDRMSDDEIREAREDAQRYAREDKLRRDALEAINRAERTLSRAEQALKSPGSDACRDKKPVIKEDCALLKKKLGKCDPMKMCENQIRELNAATDRLEADCGEACWSSCR
ncbi:MAG: molecular chaperone DnaK [Lachnospiraceae bacterium]|nr:molecular chaperone DnaK [Lachnospiraceae bacterium]